jgi:hypothetical protein
MTDVGRGHPRRPGVHGRGHARDIHAALEFCHPEIEFVSLLAQLEARNATLSWAQIGRRRSSEPRWDGFVNDIETDRRRATRRKS